MRVLCEIDELRGSYICGYGGIGRHKRLKISREQSRAGSSPATRIMWREAEHMRF